MNLRPGAACRLLHLLLLADLFVSSLSRPTLSPSLYGMFGSMIVEVEMLIKLCKKLHDQPGDQLQNFAGLEHQLQGLPALNHTAADLTQLKLNESLAQLYVYAQSFKLHVDWLKTAKDSVGMPSQSAEGASARLLVLSSLLSASLRQISEELPQSPTPPPSFPLVSTAFDSLKVSIEVANRLQDFCKLSKHVLRALQRRFRH